MNVFWLVLHVVLATSTICPSGVFALGRTADTWPPVQCGTGMSLLCLEMGPQGSDVTSTVLLKMDIVPQAGPGYAFFASSSTYPLVALILDHSTTVYGYSILVFDPSTGQIVQNTALPANVTECNIFGINLDGDQLVFTQGCYSTSWSLRLTFYDMITQQFSFSSLLGALTLPPDSGFKLSVGSAANNTYLMFLYHSQPGTPQIMMSMVHNNQGPIESLQCGLNISVQQADFGWQPAFTNKYWFATTFGYDGQPGESDLSLAAINMAQYPFLLSERRVIKGGPCAPVNFILGSNLAGDTVYGFGVDPLISICTPQFFGLWRYNADNSVVVNHFPLTQFACDIIGIFAL